MRAGLNKHGKDQRTRYQGRVANMQEETLRGKKQKESRSKRQEKTHSKDTAIILQ